MKNAGWILAAVLLMALPLCAYSEMEQVAQNERYVLYFDEADLNFCVESRATGERLYAFPENWEEDDVAKGNNKKLIGSLVSIDLYNEKNVSKTVNSRTGCMEKGETDFSLMENGVLIHFDFQEQKVVLDMKVTLSQDGFSVTVPLESIRSAGEEKLGSIRILPFMNAGKPTDDGYIFLPDGCGTLMDFDADFSLYSRVTRTIYGRDLSIMYTTLPQQEETARLPVYGIKKNDIAFLAVIAEGEYTCQLTAQAAGDNADYFRASPIFVYRELQNIVLFENTTEERTVTALSTDPVKEGISLKVFILENENANYSGMARAYRQYLLETGQLIPADTTPYLDIKLYGAAEKKVLTFGIPHNRLYGFTTFAQAIQIAREVKNAGVNHCNLLLYGFQKNGRKQYITSSVEPENSLGGQRGLNELMHFAQEEALQVTMVAELLYVYRSGNGFSGTADSAHAISDGIAYQYTPDVVTQKRDYSVSPYMLLAPEQLPARWNAYMTSAKKKGIKGVLVENWGSGIYSQYAADRFLTRDQIGYLWEQLDLDEEISLTADGGNAYVLSKVQRLVDVSSRDTDLDMTTREVPFYQMVIHGFIPYSGTPGNHVTNTRKAFLKMIEAGAYPCYEWFYADSGDTKNTCLNHIFSGHYADWITQASEEYAACEALYNATEGTPIDLHERIAKNVYKIVYENGAICYVNYNEETVSVEDVTIPGMDYILKGV